MRISGIATESIVDGPGVRFVIFAQGCPHGCEKCHNPETWAVDGGAEIPLRKIVNRVTRTKKKYRGLTLSGGEPFMQADELSLVAAAAKKKGWDVVTFTGYLYEELSQSEDLGVQALLTATDILIDGPFVYDLLDTTLPFRGSANQRMINMEATRRKRKIVLYKVDD
jgi:anaerobic ribonucleoside-triphosphate reductase activating protein